MGTFGLPDEVAHNMRAEISPPPLSCQGRLQG